MAAHSIRPSSLDDISAIAKIEAESHKAPWSEAQIRAELEKPYSHFLVMTDDETDSEVLGYIVFWIIGDKVEILNVTVAIPHRGLGLGKNLVRKAVDFCVKAGAKRILLEVRKSNVPAIHLYQVMHFVINQVRKRFYSDGEDAYQMVLELEGAPLNF